MLAPAHPIPSIRIHDNDVKFLIGVGTPIVKPFPTADAKRRGRAKITPFDGSEPAADDSAASQGQHP
jgi:hypothetical protein